MSDESAKEKTSLNQVYTDFYHQLVDAVSDPLTCQSLIAQLYSTTLISQKKIAELSSGQHTGNSFLNVLGVEEDPQLLTVLMEKMANVEQLQMLWKSMSTQLSTMKEEAAGVEYESKVAQEQLEARIAQLTNEKEELHTKWQHHEEELKTANKLLKMGEKALPGMLSQGSTARRYDDAQKRISQLEEELTRLRLQRDSCTDAAVQTNNEETEKELCQYSTETQGWSLHCSNLAREKMEMEEQYRMMLQQKDREIQQYTQLLEEKGHELIKKQQALDLMQQQPTPKPHTSISSDSQTVSEPRQQLRLTTLTEQDTSLSTSESRHKKAARLTKQLQTRNDTIKMLKSEKYELEEKLKMMEHDLQMKEHDLQMKEHDLQTMTTDFQNYQSRHSGERENLEAQLDECKRQKERMESEIEQLNAKLREVKGEVQTYTDMNVDKDEQIRTLQVQLSRAESNLRKEEEKRLEWSDQLQKLNDTIKMLKSEKYELEGKLKMKQHELQTITMDFQNYQGQHSGEREDFEAQLNKCERQKERMESEIEQLNAKLHEVRGQMQTYTGMNVKKDEQIRTLQVQLSRAESNLRKKEEKRLEWSDQLQKLNYMIKTLKSEKYELEGRLKMKQHELQTITTDFQNYQSQHSGEREDFEAQLDECEKQKERMESDIEQLNAKLLEVHNQVQTYAGMNINKDEQIHTLQVQLSRAEFNLRKKEEKRLKWSDVIDEYQSEAKSVRAELQCVQQEKQQLQSRFSQAQQEMVHLNRELRKAKDRVKEKQKHCQDHIDTSKAWRAQYEEAKNDFDVERRQREKDAQAVIMYKERISRLDLEIQQLHQKSNIQEQHIAALEAKLADSRIPAPIPPADNTQFTGELRVPRYGMGQETPQRGVGAGGMEWQDTPRPAGGGGGGGGGGGQNWPQGTHGGGGGGGGGMRYQWQQTSSKAGRRTDYQFQQPPPMDYSGHQLPQTESDALHSDPHPAAHNSYNTHMIPPQQAPPPLAAQQEFIAPGEVQNLAKPAMACSICGRQDFTVQSELTVHAAKCTNWK